MTAQQPYAPPPGSQAPPGPPKKGSNILMYLLLGCGGIAFLGLLGMGLVGFLVYSAAKKTGLTDTELADKNPALYSAQILIKANPDVEFVSLDRDAETITFKDKKSGKTVTWNAKDINNGKYAIETTDESGHTERTEIDAHATDGNKGTITIRTDKSTATWGGDVKAPDWMPAYAGSEALAGGTNSEDGVEHGVYTFKTKDGLDKVIAFYKEKFRSAGIEFEETELSNEATKMIALAGKDDEAPRTANVSASQEGGETTVQVIYQRKLK